MDSVGTPASVELSPTLADFNPAAPVGVKTTGKSADSIERITIGKVEVRANMEESVPVSWGLLIVTEEGPLLVIVRTPVPVPPVTATDTIRVVIAANNDGISLVACKGRTITGKLGSDVVRVRRATFNPFGVDGMKLIESGTLSNGGTTIGNVGGIVAGNVGARVKSVPF